MDRYQRVEKPREEAPIKENEIRITTQGRMRNYITYGTGCSSSSPPGTGFSFSSSSSPPATGLLVGSRTPTRGGVNRRFKN